MIESRAAAAVMAEKPTSLTAALVNRIAQPKPTKKKPRLRENRGLGFWR